MQNTVFFNASNATVKTQLNNKVIGYSATAEELRALLEGYAVTLRNATFLHSSDVDFASEEGFADDDAAHAIIEDALAQL
jgi:hypothetical protein